MRTAYLSIIIITIIANLPLPYMVIQTEAGEFSRTRHKAAMLALLCYNPVPALAKDFTCKRIQRIGLINSFIQEGGYIPQRAYNILSINDPEVRQIRLLINELDGSTATVSIPGPLTLCSTIALAYSRPSADGLRAAMHISRLVSVDPDTDKIARAVYSLLVYTLEGEVTNKQELIKIAAVNCDDELISRKLRGVRLLEWRKFPSEKTLLGRICRVLYIWEHADNWEQSIAMGRRLLRYTESLQFLAILSAASIDLPNMPEKFVWSSLREKEVRDICADLHELAQNGILVPIDKKLVEANNNPYQSTSKEEINGSPLVSKPKDNVTSDQIRDPALPATPASPAQPALPVSCTIPQTPLTPVTPVIKTSYNNTASNYATNTNTYNALQKKTLAVTPVQKPATAQNTEQHVYQEIAPLQPLGAFPTD